MATKPESAAVAGRPKQDDESTAVIYQGASQDQLMRLFKLDHRTAKRKLMEARQGGVVPVTRRSGTDLYAIHEVAPYFCKPVFDPAEYMRNMDPRELPKMLSKEYWAGQRSRQEFEEKAGLLWKTEKIVEEVGELMKLVKMSALLMMDAVERQTELSDRQRGLIKSLTHGMLADLMQRVNSKFVVPTVEDVKLQKAIDDEDI
jgi:hypothetical protein